jgi:hypothetical protein
MALKPETKLQIAVYKFCVAYKICMIHVPNEGKRKVTTGKILQNMGMRKGFADCFFPKGNDQFKGLFIELKVKPNKPTVDQIKFLQDMLSFGYDACVCYTLDEAIAVISRFYNLI